MRGGSDAGKILKKPPKREEKGGGGKGEEKSEAIGKFCGSSMHQITHAYLPQEIQCYTDRG